MKRIKNKLLSVILIFTIFISLFPLYAKGIDDLTFTFNDNVLFNSDISTFNDSFNLKNSQEYTGIYNGTYSFTNESVGTSGTDISFIDNVITPKVEIIDNLNGHNKVLNFSADSGTKSRVEHFFNPTINNTETIELWISTNDSSLESGIYLTNTTSLGSINIASVFGFVSQNIFMSHGNGIGGISIITVKTGVINNDWYHIRYDLNMTSDTYTAFVNGLEVLTNVNFQLDANFSEITKFIVFGATGNSELYIDAIGYSWSIAREVLDFTDDIIGNEPIGWISDNSPSTLTIIHANLDDRTNILKLFDATTLPGRQANITTSFSLNITQNIQFDYAKSSILSTAGAGIILFYENETEIISLLNDENDLKYIDDTGVHIIKDNFLLVNTFVVFLIILNHESNTFDIFLDGVLEGSNLNYRNNITNTINRIELLTSSINDIVYTWYIDNIILDNTNFYNIGLNLFPYISTDSTLKEVDKYEYAMSEINTLREIGSSTYGTWTESDGGGHNNVQIKAHPTDSNNRIVEIDTNNIGDNKGLRKNTFTLTGNFINITIDFEIITMSGSTSYNIFSIESSDTNTITAFIVWHNGSLGWFPTIVSAGIPLRDDLTTNEVYTLQILLNYELDVFILDWYIDGIFKETYIRPLITTGKSGLNEIFIRSHWIDNQATMKLYSVGVYENGVSESKEIGWSVIDIQVSDWNPKTYNLFNILGNGVMTLGIISGNYSVGESFTGFDDTINLTNVLKTLNFYELEFFNLSNPSIVFSIIGKDFSTSHLKIDGVILTEGSNEYPLIFESDGVDIDEGYFFVVGNKLHFYHISDDSNLESIQARFNINDISSEGYLVSFRSNIDNNAKGFFRVNFTSTSNLIQLPIIETTTRFILTQNRTIHDLVVLITDNDVNSITGLTEGFIHQVQLLQVENLLISVITSSLIAMMIPLLIILVPTLAISNIYGKELIIPMFIFISLVLTFTGIIPIWLFFIIAISNSVFIIKKRNEMD